MPQYLDRRGLEKVAQKINAISARVDSLDASKADLSNGKLMASEIPTAIKNCINIEKPENAHYGSIPMLDDVDEFTTQSKINAVFGTSFNVSANEDVWLLAYIYINEYTSGYCKARLACLKASLTPTSASITTPASDEANDCYDDQGNLRSFFMDDVTLYRAGELSFLAFDLIRLPDVQWTRKWMLAKNGVKCLNAMISLPWPILKGKRDAGALVPGQRYRITDYICTTTKNATSAANHVFDIIVTADADDTLSETAKAVLHEGDTYFAGCDLNSWELKYAFDNNVNRFEWADNTHVDSTTGFCISTRLWERYPAGDVLSATHPYAWKGTGGYTRYTNSENPTTSDKAYDSATGSSTYTISSVFARSDYNGRGVIYWMKDEGGNEVPYDFKNIMFERNLNDGFIVREGGDAEDVYTFTYSDVDTGEIKDASVIYQELFDDAQANIGVRDNIIKPCVSWSTNTGTPCSMLSDIVVFCNSYYDGGLFYGIIGNHFGFGCHEITLQDYCMYNEFGNSCSSIFFDSDSQHNIFSQDVHGISVGQYVSHNYFYPNCTDLDLTRGSIYYSVFDNDCYRLIITALENGDIRHIHVHSGVWNKTITVSTLNADHSIDYYAPNSETIML